jgi:hypothetical protein
MGFIPFVPTGGSVTLPVAIVDGGTGQITAPAALSALNGLAIGGAAGGSLSGTYPNPGVVLDSTATDIAGVGTAGAAGSTGKVADAGHVHGDQNVPTPSTNGLLAWSFDTAASNTGAATVTTGVVYAMRVDIYQPVTVGHLWWDNISSGSGATAGANFIALYNSSGTQLAQTGIDSQSVASSLQKIAISAQALTPGSYYVFWLVNASGMPGPMRAAGNPVQVNVGTSAATTRVATLSVPATTVAAGSNGGEISTVASWSSPSAGVLDVASSSGWPNAAGTFTVATSTTPATCTYTGTAAGQLTGVAYVSGSATGTVSTGGAVTFVTSQALPAAVTMSNLTAASAVALWVGLAA